MPLPALRVRQTTSTAGTGRLSLDAATGLWRGLQAQYGTAERRVRYVLAAGNGFEVGLGTFDGGSPGTLSRDQVLASSAAGGGLLNLAAGDAAREVFALPDLDREVLSVSGNATLGLADLGSALVFAGAAAATVALPSVQTVPPGAGYLVANAGAANLLLDPSGAEQVAGATSLTLGPGHSCHLLRAGAGWARFGGGPGTAPTAPADPGALPPAAVTRRTASSATVLDFALPSGSAAFRLSGANLAFTEDDQFFMVTSQDGGASWTTDGAGWLGADMGALPPEVALGGPSTVGVTTDGRPGVLLLVGHATQRSGTFRVAFHPGSATSPFSAHGSRGWVSSGGWRYHEIYANRRSANGAHNAVRLMTWTARFSGTFLLEGLG